MTNKLSWLITSKKVLDALVRFTVSILSSKWTPWVIAILFMLNSLWVALFYRYPLIFDESFHFETIQVFTHTLSPIIWDQPEKYNHLGSLAFGSASLYHYFMSFPLRFIELFTASLHIQVVSLRIINVLLASLGLLLYYKFFRELKIKKYLINTGLLIFAFIPIASNVAANISYDNVLFPLTALFFIYANRLLQARGTDSLLILKLLSIGTLASLIKFTFLPLFAIACVGLLTMALLDSGDYKRLWSNLVKNFKKLSIRKKTVWITLLFLLLLLAGARYGSSVILYGSPIPDCDLVMGQENCETNAVFKSTRDALLNNKDTPVADPASYTQDWLRIMTGEHAISAANTATGAAVSSSPPIYKSFLTIGIVAGVGILLFMWRSLKFNRRYVFTIICVLGLLGSTFLFNMSTYYQYRADLNTQPRYALSVLPVVLVFSVVATSSLLRRHRYIKLLLVTTLIFTLTQGGGVVTHILTSDDDWYWDDSVTIQEIQSDTKEVLEPLVKESMN